MITKSSAANIIKTYFKVCALCVPLGGVPVRVPAPGAECGRRGVEQRGGGARAVRRAGVRAARRRRHAAGRHQAAVAA